MDWIILKPRELRAILEGRQTMVRREVKFPRDFDGKEVYQNPPFGLKYSSKEGNGILHRLSAPYQPGAVIYVREKFMPSNFMFNVHGQQINNGYHYFASEEKQFIDEWPKCWKPPMYMPKSAARIWLEVTESKCERLQDISEEDAIEEGVEMIKSDLCFGYKDYLGTGSQIAGFKVSVSVVDTPKESFETLWVSQFGQESWDANRFVFATRFKTRIES